MYTNHTSKKFFTGIVTFMLVSTAVSPILKGVSRASEPLVSFNVLFAVHVDYPITTFHTVFLETFDLSPSQTHHQRSIYGEKRMVNYNTSKHTGTYGH